MLKPKTLNAQPAFAGPTARQASNEMKHRIVLIVATSALAFIQAASTGEMKRIVVFGDSLSEGLGVKPSEAYPMLLIEKLRAAGLSFEVTNVSQSGGTTGDGLRRLSGHLKRPIDIFILELGINDAFRGMPIFQIKQNLQEIIDRAKRASPRVRVVICGMQILNSAADDYVSAFSRMYSDLATKNSAALVPYLLEGVAGDPTLNQLDHIHPNPGGHRVLAENVWRVLEPIAREVATKRFEPAMPSPRSSP
jgi:acyl-CoA thioesterase-1